MIRTTLVGAAALLLCLGGNPVRAVAQNLHVGVAGGRVTYNEVAAENRQAGYGGNGVARYVAGSWGVEGELNFWVLAAQEDDALDDLSIAGGAIRVHYSIWRELDAQVSFDSRSMDPELAAQDAAALLVGLRYEAALTSQAELWIRGAAIPLAWFNGGGDAGIGVGLGFGVRVRPTNGGWGVFADYDFQRLDRTVQGLNVPIQFDGVRLGVELGF